MVSLLMFLMPRTFKKVGDRVISLFESSSKDRCAVRSVYTFSHVVLPYRLSV
jgi:hypothetical protein